MDILKLLRLIVVLFVATCCFCWIFTTNWIFGPVVTLASFVSGLLLISFLGVLIIHQESE